MAKKTNAETTKRYAVDTEHPDYASAKNNWEKVRDCLAGEEKIKEEKTKYLPQPEGMTGKYANAYDAYRERAHFPLICSYAMQGALGVILIKLPEFILPKKLEYLKIKATKDGKSLNELFLDTIIEVFTTGRRPLLVDILPKKNRFCFVPYKAENLINWKVDTYADDVRKIHLAVCKEARKDPDVIDPFVHEYVDRFRVLQIVDDKFSSTLYDDSGLPVEGKEKVIPKFMGKTIDEIPLTIAGSISNSFDIQLIPLLSVANCSIQIYRKEADLANSEFLSCNPTLIFSGVEKDGMPTVVGSSICIAIPDPQGRGYYTQTDTQALTHVKDHIKDLYDEAIRHGIALLEARKGVEAAEALRIRQATQVATVYSIYNSTLNAILTGLKYMARWAGLNESEVSADAPKALTQEIADQAILTSLVEGFLKHIYPTQVIYKYMHDTGLVEPNTSFDDYVSLLKDTKKLMDELGIVTLTSTGGDNKSTKVDGDNIK